MHQIEVANEIIFFSQNYIFVIDTEISNMIFKLRIIRVRKIILLD